MALFKVLSRYLPGRTEKTMKGLIHVNRSSGRDANPEPLEYEAGVLTAK
jgi:hypothetical protein